MQSKSIVTPIIIVALSCLLPNRATADHLWDSHRKQWGSHAEHRNHLRHPLNSYSCSPHPDGSGKCRGTDIMGNPVRLVVRSNRMDPKQAYTARIGNDEIRVERERSPLVSASWNGPVLMQRPLTTIIGEANGEYANLFTESSGLTTGEAFGEKYTCAVNGWSVFGPQPCF